MSNSTTLLDLVTSGQAQKEATVNAMFDAASPAMLYGRRASTSGGLVWGYYGGAVSISGTPTSIANGTITLTASATNYLQADPATGAVSKNTTGFSAGMTPLYSIVAGAATVTSYTDFRTSGGGAGTADFLTQEDADAAYEPLGAVAAHAAASNPHPEYLTQTEGDARYLQSIGAQPFDLTAFYPGVPGASAIVTRVPVARAVTFPSGLSGSYARASAAATGSTVFDVQKNGASVGSITFAAAATSATFTAASAINLAAGDILSIHAPGTADATLANVGIVLAGVR